MLNLERFNVLIVQDFGVLRSGRVAITSPFVLIFFWALFVSVSEYAWKAYMWMLLVGGILGRQLENLMGTPSGC